MKENFLPMAPQSLMVSGLMGFLAFGRQFATAELDRQLGFASSLINCLEDVKYFMIRT